MNVLIIPEDFRKDQYILRPLIQRMMAEVGKPNANVRVCFDPLLGGIGEATKWERVAEVLHRYRGMVQLFLLIVDRDGVASRRQTLDALEQRATTELGNTAAFFAENAWQEIEVWALAGTDLPKAWQWRDVRNEVNAKEAYFEPIAKQLNIYDEPGGGRTTLGRAAAKNYSRVRSRCKEDVEALERRLDNWIANMVPT